MNLTSSDLPSKIMLTAAPMVAMAAKHEFRSLSGTSSLVGLFFYSLISASRYALAITDASDVQALQVMYSSLNSPPELTSWRSSGGDPCTESWKGITCGGSAVVSIDISGLGLHGTMGYLLADLHSLKNLDMSRNNIQGEIPYQLPPNLTSLNVAGNNLSGNLPYSLSNIVSLDYLDLSSNRFSGDLPYTSSSLSNLSSLYLENNQLTGSLNILSTLPLMNLNVANNHFSGWVPQELYSIPNFIYGGNSFEKGPAPPPPPYSTPPPGRPRSSTPPKDFDAGSFQPDRGLAIGAIVGIIVGTVVVSLILLVVFAICVCKNKKQKTGPRSSSGQLPVVGVVSNNGTFIAEEQRIKSVAAVADRKSPPAENPTVESLQGKNGSVKRIKSLITATSYTVASLQTATNSFSQEHLIGEGSLGRVYRADFPNGKTMAIKKVDSAALSLREEDNFLQLVSNMSRLRHPNIVTLVGYCAEQGQRLLVYEYLGNGSSLHEMLHYTEDGCKTLSWNSRVRVALGCARALEYLHEVCLPSMVHRNFKSANILLDEEMNPHLSDCGLAALAPNTERQITTQLVGSFGYSAPEFALSGLYTVKSDVYSFGVVMLELLTGRKPLDSSRARSEHSLVRWATPQLHDVDALAKMVDPALNGMYPAKSLSRFADVIGLCIKPEPHLRPPMSEVVQALVRLVQRASLVKRHRSSDEFSLTWKTIDYEAIDASF